MRTRTRRRALIGGIAAIALALTGAVPATAAWLDTHHGGGGGDAATYAGQHPVVSTDKGRVRGAADALVTSWKGIPFAAPPVGDLRWKAPQPAARWSGTRDATQFGGSCTQGSGWDPGYEQPTYNEDRLYLNVYRPSTAKAKNLPVFFWIHGGGNTGGAGKDTNPDKFITKSSEPVVYVTINYRLGAMGYLDTAGLEADNVDGSAGNFGLLDQQAALKWVQRNIARFGGDPDNVTVAGQSAGAGNTCAQLASPGAKGLFDRAILQSGGCSSRTLTDARASGAQFATALGCTDAATEVACLRAATPEQVLATQQSVRTSGGVSGTAVLPTDPLALLKAGKLTKLPVVLGGVRDESQQSVFGAYDYTGNPLTEQSLAALIASTYGEDASRVAAAYPTAGDYSPTHVWGTIQSDQRACQDLTLRDRMAKNTRTYAYEFAERDAPAFTSIWRQNTGYPFGATHVNDLGYLWDYLGTALPFDSDQVALGDQMIAYWSTFAADGSPDPRFAPDWPRYRAGGDLIQFVAPGTHVVSRADLAAEHGCALWDEVAPAA